MYGVYMFLYDVTFQLFVSFPHGQRLYGVVQKGSMVMNCPNRCYTKHTFFSTSAACNNRLIGFGCKNRNLICLVCCGDTPMGWLFGLSRSEFEFYNQLANNLPLRIPRTYFVDYSSTTDSYILLLEMVTWPNCSKSINWVN